MRVRACQGVSLINTRQCAYWGLGGIHDGIKHDCSGFRVVECVDMVEPVRAAAVVVASVWRVRGECMGSAWGESVDVGWRGVFPCIVKVQRW